MRKMFVCFDDMVLYDDRYFFEQVFDPGRLSDPAAYITALGVSAYGYGSQVDESVNLVTPTPGMAGILEQHYRRSVGGFEYYNPTIGYTPTQIADCHARYRGRIKYEENCCGANS